MCELAVYSPASQAWMLILPGIPMDLATPMFIKTAETLIPGGDDAEIRSVHSEIRSLLSEMACYVIALWIEKAPSWERAMAFGELVRKGAIPCVLAQSERFSLKYHLKLLAAICRNGLEIAPYLGVCTLSSYDMSASSFHD